MHWRTWSIFWKERHCDISCNNHCGGQKRWKGCHRGRRSGDLRRACDHEGERAQGAAALSWKILAGFAGSVADAFTLFEKFEVKLESYSGNLQRAAVELAKDWRTDKVLRKLEALLLVADQDSILMISGNGEVIEPDGDCTAIGSGGFFALAAARALVAHSALDAPAIAKESLSIAADICVYTNHHITVEVLES